MLADAILRCGMYLSGKVDIYQHLAIPGSPRVTILLASPVRMLVHCVVKPSRPPDLKSSSNISLPFAWITGPLKILCKNHFNGFSHLFFIDLQNENKKF